MKYLPTSLFSTPYLVQAIYVLIIYAILLAFYKVYIGPYRRLKKLGLNGPFPKPIVGNILDFGPNQHLGQIKLHQKYGNVYGTLFLDIPTIWINDLDTIQTVMVKDFSSFVNRFSIVNNDRPPMDKVLTELRDGDWKRVRTILISAFTASKLKSLVPFIVNAGDDLVQRILDAESEGKTIDMWRTSGKFTMNVILATVFGVEIESREQEDKLTKAAGALFRVNPLQLFMLKFFPGIYARIASLVGDSTPSKVEYLVKVIKDVLQGRKKNLAQGIPCRKDMLQIMLEAGDNDKLTDEEIISQSFIFLLAGYETTANTLAYACYLLATNPDTQQKLINEIDANCPDTNSIDYECVQGLPYLDMIISETLRMYPPVFFINREIKEEAVIDGIHVSKDYMVAIPVYGIHHNPKIWPKPEQFIPERFTPEEKAKHRPCSFLPFGNGPRNCIGMRLALVEAKIGLVKILQNVELILIKETEIPLKLRATGSLSPANGIYLGFRKRN